MHIVESVISSYSDMNSTVLSNLVRNGMDTKNEHERQSNITLRHNVKGKHLIAVLQFTVKVEASNETYSWHTLQMRLTHGILFK